MCRSSISSFVSALASRLSLLPVPTSLAGLRTLHRIGTEYGQTPAQQMGITDPLAAFCLNRACLWAGTHQAELKPIM